jgi:hypothetical protein
MYLSPFPGRFFQVQFAVGDYHAFVFGPGLRVAGGYRQPYGSDYITFYSSTDKSPPVLSVTCGHWHWHVER